jgi:hypothetical protein
MRITGSTPMISPENEKPSGQFQPADFWMVIQHLPECCPLIGGQAVAWWALRYNVCAAGSEPITSEDVDFWGGRDDLKEVARGLKVKPVFPHEYEMTVWSGAIHFSIDGKRTLADFLHTVPGLEVLNPVKASSLVQYVAGGIDKKIQVLTPVSLIASKLHCLRHFSQEKRNDEQHLRICLQTARQFLAEILGQREIRPLFWNIERLISAHRFKPYRKLEQSLGFNLLEAVPVDEIRVAHESGDLSATDRERISRFLNQRWPQVTSGSDEAAEE